VFAARLSALYQLCADFDVPALVVYTDVNRANDVRYVSNFMPYWNRALTVVPRGEKPILLCSLSPRVYPWIKSVTIHETIVASPSLPAALKKLCDERGWSRLGVVDRDGLPWELYSELGDLVDIPRSAFRPDVTASEVEMHRLGARLARQGVELELTAGVSDHELTGRIERRLRRGGAEDVVVLVSDGRGVPRSACGAMVGGDSSVSVALEYNGHWVKLSRNLAGVTSWQGSAKKELLSGRYPWDGLVAPGVVSIQVAIPHGSSTLYYGDTGVEGPGGWQSL